MVSKLTGSEPSLSVCGCRRQCDIAVADGETCLGAQCRFSHLSGTYSSDRCKLTACALGARSLLGGADSTRHFIMSERRLRCNEQMMQPHPSDSSCSIPTQCSVCSCSMAHRSAHGSSCCMSRRILSQKAQNHSPPPQTPHPQIRYRTTCPRTSWSPQLRRGAVLRGDRQHWHHSQCPSPSRGHHLTRCRPPLPLRRAVLCRMPC